MAIFDRGFRNYEGELTPVWSRFLVTARYALGDAFSSRLFLVFFFLCFIWPVVCAILIYLRFNGEALALLQLNIADLFRIDADTFRVAFMNPQGALAFAVVLILGPALISPDLRNNGLPLYLSRPLDRRDYVLGKFAVLALVTSAITWVPGLLLYVFQATLERGSWWSDNLRAVPGMFFGFWVWITVLGLMSLALSALVKWKPMARILFLGLIGVLAGMGQTFNLIYDTWLGSLLDISALRESAWNSLFGIPNEGLPSWVAWSGLALLTVLSVEVLRRRLEAYEVVR